MLKRFSLVLLVGAVAFFVAAPAFADYTGVNIVPDAQVQEQGDLTILLRGDWGNQKFDDGHFVGLTYGWLGFFEIGGSWRITEDEDLRQDPVFEAKFRYDLAPDSEGCGMDMDSCDHEMEDGCACCGGCSYVNATGIAAGLWNINFDEDENGKMVPYVVYTHDFIGLRGSIGYSFQEDNGAIFTGWDVDAGEALIKWDWTQTNDGEDWNSSIGFEAPFYWDDFITGDWTIGSWLMFTSDDNGADTVTVELTYTLP